jgi:hypothetical protein
LINYHIQPKSTTIILITFVVSQTCYFIKVTITQIFGGSLNSHYSIYLNVYWTGQAGRLGRLGQRTEHEVKVSQNRSAAQVEQLEQTHGMGAVLAQTCWAGSPLQRHCRTANRARLVSRPEGAA